MKFQYHLTGKGHSGRAVQVEALAPDEADEMLTFAAKLAGTEATPIEIKKIEWRAGVKQFVVKLTEPTEDPMKATWKKATPEMFDDMSKYFTAKDTAVLEALYREYHEITVAELDAIVGKALPVAED